MEKLQEKINVPNIIVLFIVIQPIIDIFTNLSIEYINMPITFGILIRTMFLIFVTILGLIKAKNKYKIGMSIYYVALFTYMLCFLINSYVEYGTSMLFIQIKGLVKNFYLPIIIVALIPIFRAYKLDISKKVLVISLMIYVVTIFGANILGIAFPTYKLGDKAGTVGLFYSANEIGAILCMLSPFLLVDFVKDKLSISNWICLFLLVYAILQIGTKVPYFSFIILVACMIFMCFINIKITKKSYFYKRTGMFLGFLVSIYLVTGLTPVGSNLRNIYGDIFVIVPEMFQENKEPPKEPEIKIENIEELKTVSASGRNDFLKANTQKFVNGNVKDKAIGIGFIENENGEIIELKLTEMDYYDILFCNGIIGTVLFGIPTLGFLGYLIYATIKNRKKLEFEKIYSMVMAAIVALYAGHVLVSPAVSIYIAIILVKYDFEITKNKDEEIENKNDYRKEENEENIDTRIALGNRGN